MSLKHPSLSPSRILRRRTRKKARQEADLLEPGVTRLQHQVGNRAVQRALAQGLNPEQIAMRDMKDKTKDEKTLSGAHWHEEFPTSTEVSDLDGSFSGKVQKFIKALEMAGAKVEVTATKRPAERAYLMHWAWQIAKKGYNARKVPAMKGVNINWWHGDQASSKTAAQDMCDKYGLNKLKVAPALNSHHITGKAIDMKISWSGDLTLKNAKGLDILIKSSPKDHTNAELILVGKTYQVIHFKEVDKDKVHWSVDGS